VFIVRLAKPAFMLARFPVKVNSETSVHDVNVAAKLRPVVVPIEKVLSVGAFLKTREARIVVPASYPDTTKSPASCEDALGARRLVKVGGVITGLVDEFPTIGTTSTDPTSPTNAKIVALEKIARLLVGLTNRLENIIAFLAYCCC
jgi:hypothetical protein